MAESDSDELLDRARRGDVAAFEALIRPHLATVRRFAYSFTSNWADADDAAQEALAKAFRSIKSFEGRSQLSTWLFTITRGVCIDAARSQQGKQRAGEDPIDESLPDSSDDQESLLAGKDEATRLRAALARLPDAFRVPVVLFDIEGLTYDEIAAIEKVPVGTVRSRLSRGRKQLLAALQASPSARGSPGPRSGVDPPSETSGTNSDRISSTSQGPQP